MNDPKPSEDHDRGNPLEDFAEDMSQHIRGERVEVKNASVQELTGGRVSMHNSAARTVKASALDAEDTALAFVQADSLEAQESAIGLVMAREATLKEGNATFVMAETCRAEKAQIGLLLAARVEGPVKAVMTPLTGFAFGAGLGVILTLARLLFRRKQREQTSSHGAVSDNR